MVPMTIWRKTALPLLLLSVSVGTGCGDVFRPVVVPLPSAAPDPKNYHFAIVVNQNAPANPGSAMQIDVSGDTDVGVVQSGRSPVPSPTSLGSPVHAALLPPNANRVYVANGTADSVSTFTPASVFGPIGTPITITLPTGSDPIFVHSTESGTMYTANECPVPGLAPACTGPYVAAINTTSNVVTNIIPVGLNPVVLAETPNGQKLYSVNQGDNSVTIINTVNKTALPSITGIGTPVWAVAALDSTQVFVLDSSKGVIYSISSAPPNVDQIVSSTAAQPAGSGANFLFLDRHLNRLYVTNPMANTVTIYDASVANAANGTPPALIGTVQMPSGVTNPVMVTALNDGTQAFVISFQPSSTALASQVTAIRTLDNAITTTVNLPPVPPNNTACQSARFRASITSSVDSSRVYAAVCDAGTTYVIRTSNDGCVDPTTNTCLNVVSPVSAYPAVGLEPPPQNPVWVVTQ